MALSGVDDHKETAALGGKVLGLAYRLGEDAIEFNLRLNYFIRKIVFKVHQELTDGDIVDLKENSRIFTRGAVLSLVQGCYYSIRLISPAFVRGKIILAGWRI